MSATKAFRQGFGINTAEVISDTSAHTGKNYQLIYVASAAVISSITAPNLTGASGLVGLTLPAGFQICTNVTAITLTSGVVIAYDSCNDGY